MKIDKSDEIRQKEARIAELETQIKRTRSTLKGLKTRLGKTQQRVEEMQREIFDKVSRMQERISATLQRLEELMNKMRREQRLEKEEQDHIEQLYDILVGGMQDHLPDPEEAADSDPEEEEERAKYREAFREFRVEPPREEKQDIRKLYLRLSKLVHPDRARNEREARKYHQYQQQVNEAYEKHDIHTLLDLEQRFSETWEDADPEEATASVDALDHRISRLEHQLNLLQQQKERLSREIKGLRQSDMGQMLTGVDSMKRAGFSMDDTMGLSQMEEFVKMMDAFESAIRDTAKRGEPSPELEDLMQYFQTDTLSLEALLNEMIEEEVGANFFWEADEYEDYDQMGLSENPNPKFPPGAYVRIRAAASLGYVDENFQTRDFNIKGLTGVVSEALIDDDVPVYNLMLDSSSMKKLPKDYIELEGPEFHVLNALEEPLLGAEKRKKLESLQRVRKTHRTLLYENIFSELEEKQAHRLQSILLDQPEADDTTNWLEYLEANLSFPFKAKISGDIKQTGKDQPVTVVNYGGYSPDHGLIVQVQKGRELEFIPLYQLIANPRTKVGRILKDYEQWYVIMESF